MASSSGADNASCAGVRASDLVPMLLSDRAVMAEHRRDVRSPSKVTRVTWTNASSLRIPTGALQAMQA